MKSLLRCALLLLLGGALEYGARVDGSSIESSI